jgi:cytochrome c5
LSEPPVAKPGADDQFEPTPIMPVPDLGPRVRRARRRRRVIALWVAVSLLVLGQVGAAVYLQGRRGRRATLPARPAIGAAPAARARPTTLPVAVASRPASVPATAPVAVDDGDTVVRDRPHKKKGKRKGKRPRGQRARRAAERPAAAAAADPAKGTTEPVDDVVVPLRRAGSAGKGARLFRMGCGLCHGQRAKAINPGQFSPAQWKRYFATGVHGRHDKLRAHFTRAELADVKAYLISAAK